MISNTHAALLALLARSRKGMTGAEIETTLDLGGVNTYVTLARMVDNGWLTRHPEPRQDQGGTPLVRHRITDLGKLALKYAKAERRKS